jgi:hypothetical protein
MFKKKEKILSTLKVYGRLLRINNSIAMRTTIIMMNSPMLAGTKYVSATDSGAAVAKAVAWGAD